MTLHVDSLGSGAPLLLLHGWGMHGGMWGEAAERLARDFRVLAVDLPGHGWSVEREGGREMGGLSTGLSRPFTLDTVVDQLAAQFDEPLAVCGWSLGGIIAQRWAARAPHRIRRLVLVASTPCFVARDGWPYGMPAATLQQFAADLEQDAAATLRRFLALQVRGSEGERELLAALRAGLSSRGAPQPDALRGGLDILRDADLRASLPQIGQPTLLIAGDRDRLTPPQASHHLAQTLPHARMVTVQGAAHAPFLSHTGTVVEHMKSFLHE